MEDAKPKKLTKEEKTMARIKEKMMGLLEDATDIVHASVKGEDCFGKKVQRTQLFAALPIVKHFGPALETQEASGGVHLHLNIPRPQIKAPEVKVIDAKSEQIPLQIGGEIEKSEAYVERESFDP